jgi:four helix bundle protein
MFLQLAHTNLEVYPLARKLVTQVYLITIDFPKNESFNMTSQMQRSALSVLLNIAEGSARRSANERCRFYEIARASLVELDAAFDIAQSLEYFRISEHPEVEEIIVSTFKKISLLIKSTRDSI